MPPPQVIVVFFVALGAGGAWGQLGRGDAAVHSRFCPDHLDDILSLLNRTLDDANTPALSPNCNETLRYVIDSAADRQLWALRLFDSMGKPSSGILESSLTFLGVYSECVSVTSPSQAHQLHHFQGKYCIASLQLDSDGVAKAQEKVGTLWTILNNVTTVGSMPRFGVCFPSLCSANDISNILRSALSNLLNTSQVNLTSTCSPHESPLVHDPAAIVILSLFSILLLLVVTGTLFDIMTSCAEGKGFYFFQRPFLVNARKAEYGSQQDTNISVISHTVPTSASSEVLCADDNDKQAPRDTRMGQILLSFSFKTNGQKILQTSSSGGAIDALNGIRVLSMWWIIIGHSYSFALQWLVFSNKVTLSEVSNTSIISQLISNGTFSVDTFFFLSGFLVAYVSMKQLNSNNGKLSIPLYYFHRFWRMTPLMMAIIAFCACLLPYVGQGPNWSLATTMYDSWCKKNWWTNAIYLNNFINREEMCLSHSWYSAVDMQFYVISPVIILLLYRKPRYGFLLLGFLLLTSIIITAVLTAVNHYPAVPYTNNIVSQELMNAYYGYVYIKPYCRIGPYFVGMALGYFVATSKNEVNLRKYYRAFGWIASVTINLAILLGMWPASEGHLPSVAAATIYGAITRTLWGCGIAWVTFACIYGYGGFVNTFLSWKAWAPLSRLTYCAYLIHPVVMAIFYGTRERALEFSNFFMLYVIIGNIVITYVCSFILSLCFESPFLGLEKVLLRKKK